MAQSDKLDHRPEIVTLYGGPKIPATPDPVRQKVATGVVIVSFVAAINYLGGSMSIEDAWNNVARSGVDTASLIGMIVGGSVGIYGLYRAIAGTPPKGELEENWKSPKLIEAMESDLVGVRYDGYVGSVSDKPAEDTQHLVDETNSRWKANYQTLADTLQEDLQQIELEAGKQLQSLASNLIYFMNEAGEWQKLK